MIPLEREDVVHARALLIAAEREILAELEYAEDRRRGHLAAELFAVRKMLGEAPLSFSQAGQDVFLDENVFFGRTGGVFVEAGAYDGVTGSNTLFFETFRGWTGLLIEPVPHLAEAARHVRRSPCVTAALGESHGTNRFLHIVDGFTLSSGLLATIPERLLSQLRRHPRHREELIEVPVRPLYEVLQSAGIAEIDYLSLDIEGAEETVLQSFPFDEIDVLVWTIENNCGSDRIERIMSRHGYILADFLLVDEVYIREDVHSRLSTGRLQLAEHR